VTILFFQLFWASSTINFKLKRNVCQRHNSNHKKNIPQLKTPIPFKNSHIFSASTNLHIFPTTKLKLTEPFQENTQKFKLPSM